MRSAQYHLLGMHCDIYECGTIRQAGREVKTRDDGRGYPCFDMMTLQGYRTKKVHRVVWEAFNCGIPKGMHVDHINHNKTDNRLENLRLRCARENSADCAKTSRRGSRVLTGEQRGMVLALISAGFTTKQISKFAKIGQTTVRTIKKSAYLTTFNDLVE